MRALLVPHTRAGTVVLFDKLPSCAEEIAYGAQTLSEDTVFKSAGVLVFVLDAQASRSPPPPPPPPPPLLLLLLLLLLSRWLTPPLRRRSTG